MLMILPDDQHAALYEAHRKMLPNKRLDAFEDLPEWVRDGLRDAVHKALPLLGELHADHVDPEPPAGPRAPDLAALVDVLSAVGIQAAWHASDDAPEGHWEIKPKLFSETAAASPELHARVEVLEAEVEDMRKRMFRAGTWLKEWGSSDAPSQGPEPQPSEAATVSPEPEEAHRG